MDGSQGGAYFDRPYMCVCVGDLCLQSGREG